jgi:dTDP-4-dehydrorhamnose 3,5-epimerase
MHYQVAPAEEVKIVRCTMGAIYDVTLDLRLSSPTYLQWFAIELSAANRKGVYIPRGCAHGLLTLHDNTEVLYQMSGAHVPECARGVRWDDEAFGIEWPADPLVIAERDRDYPDFSITAHLASQEESA